MWRRSKAARRASIALVGGDGGDQAPAGASLVIVVRLASATRRPTVLYAHHDRDSAASMVIVVRLVSATVSMDELPLVGSDPCRDRPLCAFGVICRLGR